MLLVSNFCVGSFLFCFSDAVILLGFLILEPEKLKKIEVSCGNWKTKYLATPFKECFKTCLQYQTVSLSVSFQCDATSLPKMICCTNEESLSFPYRKMLEAKP